MCGVGVFSLRILPSMPPFTIALVAVSPFVDNIFDLVFTQSDLPVLLAHLEGIYVRSLPLTLYLSCEYSLRFFFTPIRSVTD